MASTKQSESLSTLARSRVAPAVKTAVEQVNNFDPKLQPHHPDVQRVRATVREAKLLLDVFEPVFSAKDEKGKDVVVSLRQQLNRAYEELGKYKDLAVAAEAKPGKKPRYSPEVLEQRRKALAKALAPFEKPAQVERLLAPLQTPLEGEVVIRPPSQRSRLFWTEIPLEPDPQLPGIESVRQLVRAQVSTARRELQALSGLSKVSNEHEAERIHDVRKRLRSALLLIRAFPGLGKKSELTVQRRSLSLAIRRLEQVQDLSVRLRAAPGKKESKAVQASLNRQAEKVLSKERVARLIAELEGLESMLERSSMRIPEDSPLRSHI